MRKYIFSIVIMLMAVLTVNAQTAVQTAKLFDNTYIGATIGATTPMDFNSTFPLNTTIGVRVGKDITPAVGGEIEFGTTLNDNHFNDAGTFFKAHYLGGNLVLNWMNIVGGYKGGPRTFEVKTVTGLGWARLYQANINKLGAKTGLELTYNINPKSAISLQPAVYWGLYTGGVPTVQFNKNHAQLYLGIGYTYKFKTSNGTHSFKQYNIGDIVSEYETRIADLEGKLTNAQKMFHARRHRPDETKASAVVKTDTVYKNKTMVVMFAKNSAELTDEARQVLDNINDPVSIVATASPEGTVDYNQKLSDARAAVVAKYLTERGVTVTKFWGAGVTGDSSNRVAIITLTE